MLAGPNDARALLHVGNAALVFAVLGRLIRDMEMSEMS